jgi:hypothetical protein
MKPNNSEPQAKKRMVCKLQRSISTSEAVDQVLIYNRERSYEYQGDLSDELREFMRKRLKMFVFCHIEGTEFVVEGETNWRSW